MSEERSDFEKLKELRERVEFLKKRVEQIEKISRILYGKSILNYSEEDCTRTIKEHLTAVVAKRESKDVQVQNRVFGIDTKIISSMYTREINMLSNLLANCPDDAILQNDNLRGKLTNFLESDVSMKINCRNADYVYNSLFKRFSLKFGFSKLSESALKKIVSGETHTITDEEKFSLRMLAYFSEYLHDSESTELLKPPHTEAGILMKMDDMGTRLVIDENNNEGYGIPEINADLLARWSKRYPMRKNELESAGYTGMIAGFDTIDMLVGTRNGIAHGNFTYDSEKRVLLIRGNVDKIGILECAMNDECVLDLCKNYFQNVESSTILMAAEDNFDGKTQISDADLLRYYLNSNFSYNGWVLGNTAESIRQTEPLKSSISKVCAYFKNTNSSNFVEGETSKNNTKMLSHLRNAAVHNRITTDGETIVIRDFDKDGNETFYTEISKENLRSLILDTNITVDIESATQVFLSPSKKDERAK